MDRHDGGYLMGSMLENESHLYLCSELGTGDPLIDTGLIGGKNSDVLAGTVTGDGSVRNLDGISARIGFSTGIGTSPWVWSNVNGCAGYIKWINQATSLDLNGVLKVICGQEITNGGPYMFWDDFGGAGRVNAIGFTLNLASTTEKMALGREMKVGEAFVIAWSYDQVTKAYIYALKSDDSSDPIDLSASGTMAVAPIDNTAFYLGSNAGLSNLTKSDFDQFGPVIGTQYLLSELQADADTLLFPSVSVGDPSLDLITQLSSTYLNLD